MSAEDLSTAIAAGLGAAVILGWLLHWLWCLMARMTSGERGRIRDLVNRLHEAEEAREALDAEAKAAAANHAGRIAALEQTLADLRAEHEADLAARAAEQQRLLRDAGREAEDAWTGLANARHRIGDLEREIETLRGHA